MHHIIITVNTSIIIIVIIYRGSAIIIFWGSTCTADLLVKLALEVQFQKKAPRAMQS